MYVLSLHILRTKELTVKQSRNYENGQHAPLRNHGCSHQTTIFLNSQWKIT
jgi:hypothetical protein